ncbi:MAG: ATP-binding cassette domain-containing protein, partial [Phycisphaerales bacterium]|nr:ATP-binding cassette domain-containing protein [Phycisphaerales bacterium]
MADVVVTSLVKAFPGGVRAVDGIDLHIADGEFVVLVGPSGCGKSTTLRMVAGLEEPTGGDISIGGRRVNDVAPRDRNIAMVFQNYALYPHLTVASNMSFGLERRRRYPSVLKAILSGGYRQARAAEGAQIRERVRAAAAMLGIESLLRRKPRELSGGQRQRVAVGRAIVRDPAVFLFDEPLSNLDAKLRGEMRTELRILHRRLKATMIYVTHDQEEAMSLADRIVVMKDGRIQQVGAPSEVYGSPANRFVASFIGTPTINVLEGSVDGPASAPSFRWTGGTIPLHPSGAHMSAAGSLGLRPDRLEPVGGPSASHGGEAGVYSAPRAHITGSMVAIERYGD